MSQMLRAIVFTCSPRSPSLSLDRIMALHGLAPLEVTSGTRWLKPNVALELQVSISAEMVATVITGLREELGAESIDVNCIDADHHRRKQLLIADMDSTVIQQECIDEIAAFAGVGDKVSGITERAMQGEIDFDGALRERVGLLQGLAETDLLKVIEQRIELTDGARALVGTMKAHGAYCALVSGGFRFFTSKVKQLVGFDEDHANTLEFEDGRLTGTVRDPILGREAKLQRLEAILQERNLASDTSLAVGDGANDLAMIERAGLGVAFRAKPIVATQADAEIKHCDLTGLLYLQGYTEDEFTVGTA